jgi:hypothetical protein
MLDDEPITPGEEEQETAVPAELEPVTQVEPTKARNEEMVEVPKSEVDALRRQLAEANKAQRRIEADQKKAEDERQRQQGHWKQLAEEKDKELTQEREEKARSERERRITKVATRMKFLDPADVIHRVSVEDGQDETLIEAALERIAKASSHLVAKEGPPKPEIGQVLEPAAPAAGPGTGPQPPAGKAPLRTMADVDALSERELAERMPEVDVVLAAQKQ